MQGGLLLEPSLGRVPRECPASDLRDLLQAGSVGQCWTCIGTFWNVLDVI